jgi:hypothetical protein
MLRSIEQAPVGQGHLHLKVFKFANNYQNYMLN